MDALSSPVSLTIAITGASGLVGRALCTSLASRGHQIRALIRRPDASLGSIPNLTTHTCDLPGRIDAVALRGCDCIIHAAYVTRFRNLAEAREVNELGTRRLLEFSRKAGIPRFIFISSTSAHADARSYYGQSKHRLEGILDPARDLIIRPGLVLAAQGGLFARLAAATTGKRWTIPLVAGGRQPMQTIHVEDLCEGVRLAVERKFTGALTLASPERLTTREFFAAVAERLKRTPRFINLPAAPMVAALRLAERLGINRPLSSENVLGLVGLRYWDTEPDLQRLGLTVRPLGLSLAAMHLS
jgi:nucleoside-diphosphate-sugar epimerase